MPKARRIWHYLKGNENSETIHSAVFVDCETEDIEAPKGCTGKRLVFGWACFVRRIRDQEWSAPEWHRFTTPDEFWSWCLTKARKKSKLWVWCHNANFDYPAVHAFSSLPRQGWQIQSAIADGVPTVIKYRKDGATLVLADTLNIWRKSLKELGELVGLEKLTMPSVWGMNEGDDVYCRRDVEIIYKAITSWCDWLRDNDMGGFTPTVAAQAMRTYRHKYMNDKILIDCDPAALKLARSCYHGGRVECGFIGRATGNFHLLDINSMYPFVMREREYPLILRRFFRHLTVREAAAYLKDYCICAHVTVETPEPFLPVVKDGKLVFPVGRFDAYVSTPELAYAIEHEYLREIESVAIYEKGIPFREFVDDIYGRRLRAVAEGKLIEAGHYKLLLNSFYGKWGQNGRKWNTIGRCGIDEYQFIPVIDAQTLKVTKVRHFAGLVQQLGVEDESSESHPAIAAHVTAHARMLLWALIRQIPAEHYLYCDTDSVLVTDEGKQTLSHLIDQKRLGALKEVHEYHDIFIHGCKDLVLDGKVTLKGVRPSAEEIEPNTYRQLKWYSIRGLMREHSLDMPLTSIVTKTLRRNYDKGIVTASGFTLPLHFPLST